MEDQADAQEHADQSERPDALMVVLARQAQRDAHADSQHNEHRAEPQWPAWIDV